MAKSGLTQPPCAPFGGGRGVEDGAMTKEIAVEKAAPQTLRRR